jgi:small ligand-binding sensory domain FIST
MSDPVFSAACATGNDWKSACQACMDSLDAIPGNANLGFIYLTDALAADLERMLEYFRSTTGVADWTGSVGNAICCSGKEIYDTPAVAIMLAALPADSYRLIPADLRALADTLAAESGWLEEQSVHFGIVHGDPRNSHVPQIIESLSTQLNPGFLVGGLSSADSTDHLLQVAGSIQQDGLSGVLLSAAVPVISGMTQGCTPLPGKHVITRCQGNILAELDGRPALDVFSTAIGDVLARDLARIAGYIFAAFPVPGSDTGDYLVRNLIGIDTDDRLLVIGDHLEEDTRIMFCRRDSDAALQDMGRMLDDLAKRARGNICGGLYFSCLGRGRHQFGEDSQELRMIRDRLGDFPLVGFFANGEISHNRLYGYTGVLTLFV